VTVANASRSLNTVTNAIAIRMHGFDEGLQRRSIRRRSHQLFDNMPRLCRPTQSAPRMSLSMRCYSKVFVDLGLAPCRAAKPPSTIHFDGKVFNLRHAARINSYPDSDDLDAPDATAPLFEHSTDLFTNVRGSCIEEKVSHEERPNRVK
jgi:hypothetical protein